MLTSISLSQIFFTLASYSTLIPLIVAIYNRNKLDYPLKYLSYLIYFSACIEIISAILWWQEENNLPLLHIFVVVEFILIGWMYQLHLYKLYNRYLIPVLIVAFSIFSIINSLFIQSIYTFNTYARPIGNLLFIIFAISYYYKLLKELKIRYLERNPMFWINTGILIYFSGSLFLFIFSNYLLKQTQLNNLFWSIHAGLNVFINVLYAIGLWLSRENLE